jgi:hypothetical protein
MSVFIRNNIITRDMKYLLTAIGLTPGGGSTSPIWLTPGGSSTSHIYTQTEHIIQQYSLVQCFSTFVRPRPGKYVFYKTRARGPNKFTRKYLSIFFKFIH